MTSRPKEKSRERTKEELAARRKEMMKSKVKKKEDHFQKEQSLGIGIANQKINGKEPPMELMHRLARGEKPKVISFNFSDR